MPGRTSVLEACQGREFLLPLGVTPLYGHFPWALYSPLQG